MLQGRTTDELPKETYSVKGTWSWVAGGGGRESSVNVVLLVTSKDLMKINPKAYEYQQDTYYTLKTNYVLEH